MSVENGGNHDRETIESNAKGMFDIGIDLLRAQGQQVRIARFWKFTQFDSPFNYEGQLVKVRIRAGEELDKAESVLVNIGGEHSESIKIKKVTDSSGKVTYKAYGGQITDPAGTTLGEKFSDRERAKKSLSILLAIKSEIEAEKLA